MSRDIKILSAFNGRLHESTIHRAEALICIEVDGNAFYFDKKEAKEYGVTIEGGSKNNPEELISPLLVIAADGLAMSVNKLVKEGFLDSRSDAADRLLNYASMRFGDRDPIGDLEKSVTEYENRPAKA
ncbi:MAG: hypothetical protein ABR875_01220 [Minisyncoccia bacterium]|jgi:hypothetical protein